jgi:CheY-like chemotaxis protein
VYLPVLGVPRFETLVRNRARSSEPAPDQPLGLAGLRILVVDDQRDARDLIGTILREYGAKVRVAESAAAAIEALDAEPFDVLVSDIGMPLEDGYVLIKRIRTLHDRPDISRLPAVALTAYARNEDQKQALESGYDVHVVKPIEPTRLVAAVMAVTHRS